MLAQHNAAPGVADLRAHRPAVLRGLLLLLQAHEYVLDLCQDCWGFAVEIQALQDAGMTKSDLRWLRSKGYVDHAIEVTTLDDSSRVFQPALNLRFGKRTCFALTPSGVAYAEELWERTGRAVERAVIRETAPVLASVRPGIPVWDRDRQELRLGVVVIKRFKAPAPNQEAVLSAFEEEGWPIRVDDPIPPHRDQDPKRRLHDTITALNRNQRHYALRFTGDGSGRGVRWELLNPSEEAKPGCGANGEAMR
jgi:hypothetical protein